MAFEYYINQGAKRLRCGYTTGSCAALAAGAAAEMLFSGQRVEAAGLQTPKGIPVTASIVAISQGDGWVRCAVEKDGGDDCDVTDGARIFATVTKTMCGGITIDGGEGVGRVTKKGLDQPIGAAAINSAPRRMIAEQVAAAVQKYTYSGGVAVLIEVPKGVELAQKTFNPRLGIVGGISILGTSGIVEPQSLQALADSIRVEVKMLAESGHKRLIITPGNYGEAFLAHYPQLKAVEQVKCANFIGDTLDFAAANSFEQLLVVGHIGKLVKLAGGVMNTHSRYADCRTQLFALYAALAGADIATMRELMCAATADSCLAILQSRALLAPTIEGIAKAAQAYLEHRAAGAFHVGLVIFSNCHGLLAVSDAAQEILEDWGVSL